MNFTIVKIEIYYTRSVPTTDNDNNLLLILRCSCYETTSIVPHFGRAISPANIEPFCGRSTCS